MEAIAGHPNVALLIAVVAFYVVLGVVEALRAPSKPKSRPRAPRESAVEREERMRRRYAGYRTKRVGFMVTFPLFGAEKSVLKLVGANLKDGQNVLVL